MGGGTAEIRALQDRVWALMDEIGRLDRLVVDVIRRVGLLESGRVAPGKPAVTSPVRPAPPKRGR